ncbi:MAG: peptidoglycan DD-metalloendopeptidase family protein [Catalinimonas sp.]
MRCLLLLTFCLLTTTVQAQSRSALEKERAENQRRKQEAARTLRQTVDKKQATLGQLNAYEQQIEAQKKIITSLEAELDLLQGEFAVLEATSAALTEELERLKEEYTQMVYAASKTRSYDRLLFLFSAGTFDQFARRLRYLQQYAEMRGEQAREIAAVQDTLAAQRRELNAKLAERRGLLDEQLAENTKLVSLQNEQRRLVRRLSSRELELRREVTKREQADQKLEKLIADLIRREMRKANSSDRSAGRVALTPETAMISNSFAANKQRLVWPVRAGFISGRFGRHPHPVLPNVTVENQGVDIQTNAGESVRAVFDGKVGFVASIPGRKGRIVSVQHGEYFTVYAGLKEVRVKTGQQLKTKDIIGEVYTDKDGVAQLQFQIWKNDERLDPQAWLYRK